MKQKVFLIVMFIFHALMYCQNKIEENRLSVFVGPDGLNDYSFNDSAYKGCLEHATALGFSFYFGDELIIEGTIQKNSIHFIIPPSYQLLKESIITEIKNGATCIIGVGFMYTDIIEDMASMYPNIDFAIIDNTTNTRLRNIIAITFHEEQTAFLAGALAGKICIDSGKRNIGFIGGMKMPLVDKYFYGYSAGAIFSSGKNLTIHEEYTSKGADGFSNTLLAEEVSRNLYDFGISVIYPALSDQGMKGLFASASKTHNYAFGIDGLKFLQAELISEELNKYVIGATIKNIGQVIKIVHTMHYEKEWSGGNYCFGLEENAISLEINQKSIAKEYKTYVQELSNTLVTEKIKIPTDEDTYLQFIQNY